MASPHEFRRYGQSGIEFSELLPDLALARTTFASFAPSTRIIQEDLLLVMEIVWADEATHSLAMAALVVAQRRKLSLVDCISFAVMRARGSQVAFASDEQFLEERFVFPTG